MKLRPRRALLVVAKARVDQDRMMPGLDDKGMKAEDEPAARWLDQPRSEQIGVRPHDLRVEIGKELRRREERPLEFGYAMNFELADTRRLHLPLRFPSAGRVRQRGTGVDRTPARPLAFPCCSGKLSEKFLLGSLRTEKSFLARTLLATLRSN